MFYFNSTLKFNTHPANARHKNSRTTYSKLLNKTPKKYSFDEIMAMNNNKRSTTKKYTKIAFSHFQFDTKINRQDFDSIFDTKQEIEAKRQTDMIRSNLPNVLRMSQKKFQNFIDLNKLQSTNIENFTVPNSPKNVGNSIEASSSENRITNKNQSESSREIVIYKKASIKKPPELFNQSIAKIELSNTNDLRMRHVQFSPEPSIIRYEKIDSREEDQRPTSPLNKVLNAKEANHLDKESFAYYSQLINLRNLKLIDEKNSKYTWLLNKYENADDI